MLTRCPRAVAHVAQVVRLAAVPISLFFTSTKLPMCTSRCKNRVGTHARKRSDAAVLAMRAWSMRLFAYTSVPAPSSELLITQLGPILTPAPKRTLPIKTDVDVDEHVATHLDFAANIDALRIDQGRAREHQALRPFAAVQGFHLGELDLVVDAA